MSYLYDNLLKHNGVQYDYSQNRANSSYSNILAIDKNGMTNIIGYVRHKDNKFIWHEELPVAIKRRIENAWNEL